MKKVQVTNANVINVILGSLPEATPYLKGLLNPVLYGAIRGLVVEYDMVAPLCNNSKRFVFFKSTFVANITPDNSNWVFGFSVKANGSEGERQFVFTYGGKIYTRLYSKSGWGEFINV